MFRLHTLPLTFLYLTLVSCSGPDPPLTNLPQTTLPQTTLPQTTLSQTTLPQTTLPQTTLPESSTLNPINDPQTTLFDPLDQFPVLSKDLTQKLLSLDLGFNVLNNQLLRESIGHGFLGEEANNGGEGFDDFFSDDHPSEDIFSEYLPQPSPLVSKDDFSSGPSPDSWTSNERFFFTRPTRRRRPRPQHDKLFVGDQAQCLTGSCEFFLFCWLQGGVVEGGCGGFLMSCCNKPNQVGHKTIVNQVGPKL